MFCMVPGITPRSCLRTRDKSSSLYEADHGLEFQEQQRRVRVGHRRAIDIDLATTSLKNLLNAKPSVNYTVTVIPLPGLLAADFPR